MTKQTRGTNRNGRKGDPNQDVQPWLGWIAAMLIVVIVVVAVILGVNRGDGLNNGAPEVSMTPIVGGMAVPVATVAGTTSTASEVTPAPAQITKSTGITMVTVVTTTDSTTTTDTFTATGEMTPTAELTATESVSATEAVTEPEAVTPTTEITATEEISTEAPAEPTVAPTPRPTATTPPTPVIELRDFEAGDIVVASGGQVEIYADATLSSLVLDSFGPTATLEVLDPSGDYESYPVLVDGHHWARVRAEDGLVGWVMTDQVEAQ